MVTVVTSVLWGLKHRMSNVVDTGALGVKHRMITVGRSVIWGLKHRMPTVVDISALGIKIQNVYYRGHQGSRG